VTGPVELCGAITGQCYVCGHACADVVHAGCLMYGDGTHPCRFMPPCCPSSRASSPRQPTLQLLQPLLQPPQHHLGVQVHQEVEMPAQVSGCRYTRTWYPKAGCDLIWCPLPSPTSAFPCCSMYSRVLIAMFACCQPCQASFRRYVSSLSAPCLPPPCRRRPSCHFRPLSLRALSTSSGRVPPHCPPVFDG
jgi:hypothetical protein